MTREARRRTSRVLNDESFMLGLSYSDVTVTGIILLGLLILGKALKIESMLWALVLAVAFLTLLIPIRLKYRRRIIRDYVSHFFRSGVIRVSKNHRIRK